MDIARPDLLQKRKRRFAAFLIVALLMIAALLIVVYRLKPAAPTVDRSTIWPDTVKRGPMIRQVRGSTGTLVPREDKLRLIPAETEATVTRILCCRARTSSQIPW
jgi:HlyD family secretion protein